MEKRLRRKVPRRVQELGPERSGVLPEMRRQTLCRSTTNTPGAINCQLTSPIEHPHPNSPQSSRRRNTHHYITAIRGVSSHESSGNRRIILFLQTHFICNNTKHFFEGEIAFSSHVLATAALCSSALRPLQAFGSAPQTLLLELSALAADFTRS